MQLPFTFLTTGEVFHVEENLHLLLEGWRVVFTLQKDIKRHLFVILSYELVTRKQLYSEKKQ